MKLLTRLRELRNQHLDSSSYDYYQSTNKIESELVGVGAITTSDIARLNLETENFEEISTVKN
jgi:regulator of PEP synthase PpsR (kinase-PPPase family)